MSKYLCVSYKVSLFIYESKGLKFLRYSQVILCCTEKITLIWKVWFETTGKNHSERVLKIQKTDFAM